MSPTADTSTVVRGFAVVVEEPAGPTAVWLVGYDGRSAASVNAVVLDPADPEKQSKLDSLLTRQMVLGPTDRAHGSAEDVCQLLVKEALRVGRLDDVAVPPDYDEPRPGSTVAEQALAVANQIVTSWNFWLKTMRKFPKAPRPETALPASVLDMMVPGGRVVLVGGGI